MRSESRFNGVGGRLGYSLTNQRETDALLRIAFVFAFVFLRIAFKSASSRAPSMFPDMALTSDDSCLLGTWFWIGAQGDSWEVWLFSVPDMALTSDDG